jgi:hypothetical protein
MLKESGTIEELCCDTDSKEDFDGSHISSENVWENDSEELDLRCKVPANKACAHQFVWEHWIEKMVMPHIDRNSQLLNVFVLFFEWVFRIIFEETEHHLHLDMPSTSVVVVVKMK